MPFGRYRGRSLGELPDNYLGWLFSLDDLWEPLRAAVDHEWHRRVRQAPPTALATLPREAVPVADELVTAGYRALTRRHHPDAGGDHRTMTLVNTAVAWLRHQVRSVA
jgi:hypothetical protein